MSEDRTQPASKHRRQMARERGQAAHSPELTAAAGWVAAVAALGIWGESLTAGLVALVRSPLEGGMTVAADPVDAVWRVRAAVLTISTPLAMILGGFLLGAFAAHQAQVRGLWAPSLIAPDVSRLWRPGRGGGLSAQFERGAWSIVKALILGGAAVWGIQSQWDVLMGLGGLEPGPAASAALGAILAPARLLAGLLLVVGLVDYALRFARFEAMLRTTPQEQREDRKMVEGDPAARASRRRLAQSWLDPTPDLLAGASLVLLGDAGLAVALSGGPPPRKVSIRLVARGASGTSLRKAALRARIPRLEARQLAGAIAALPREASAKAAVRDPLILSQLRSVWPVD